MQLIRPDFTNFCDNDTTFVILLLTTICETTHEQCRGAAHFCFVEMRRPACVRLLNPTISVQHLAHCFKTLSASYI